MYIYRRIGSCIPLFTAQAQSVSKREQKERRCFRMHKRLLATVCLIALFLSTCILPVYGDDDKSENKKSAQLAAGAFHSVWIGENGEVNGVGRVRAFDGVEKWHDVVKVAAWHLTIGVKENGSVVLAGEGTNTYNYGIISGWSDIVDVDANECNIAALTSAGTVVVAGSNYYDQCDVSYWTDITQIAVGERNVYGLKENGTVVCSGQTNTKQSKVSMWRDITEISAGNHYVAGLKKDGTVVLKGDSFPDPGAVAEWEDITAIAAGSSHLVGIRKDGTVIAAGSNEFGQCNVGGWTDIVAVSAGRFHTIGMKSDGTIVVTGSSANGQCDF